MADHRSSELRHMPEWAVVPFWILVLVAMAGVVADTVAICVYYVSAS